MIWDFRGPDAEQIAEHYRIHLDQYAVTNELTGYEIGIESVSSMYCTAFFEVLETDEEKVAATLRPHRLE